MRKPSKKRLELAFPGKGKVLRQLLDSENAVRQHPAAVELERQCYGKPPLSQLRMEALNAELENYGVEAVWSARFPRHQGNGPAFEYLNTGDSYAATIIRWANGRYDISSWGDIVERGNYE